MSFSTRKYFSLLEKGKFKAAIEYRSSDTPEFIYKFVSLNENTRENEKRLDSLRNKSIWFSLPYVQNDPFEFKGIFLDRERLLSASYPVELIDGMQKIMESGFIVSSFTGNMEKNLPMWANYANNHQGYCLKYRVREKTRVLSVLYEPKRIPIASIPAQFISSWKEFHNGIGTDEDLREANQKMNFSAMLMKENYFIKHDSWKAEDEYRIVCSADDLDKDDGKNVYAEEVGLDLVAVYTGINCNHHDEIVSICSTISIPCYECKTSESDFEIICKER